MKKALLCLLVLSLGITLNAQENIVDVYESPHNGSGPLWNEFPWSLGGGAMYDHNSRTYFALGYGIGIERYLFTPYAALGLRATLHTDFKNVTNTEAALNFRAYIPAWRGAWFTQWGFGWAIYREEDRERSTYILDLAAGYRLYLGRFYIEPFVRTGYPFVVGAGLNAGRQFNF